jgi:serine/threonine-protein kinase
VPPLAAIQAELTVPGGAPRPLPVVELTRGGLFLGAERDLPPLFSRVRIALRHPALRAPLALDAEVVRQVKPEDAARLRMAPGLALQLVELPPEARAALVALADAVAGPAPARPPPDPSRADARLEGLLSRVGDGPYALLGVAPDAEFIEIRRAGRALLEELEALRARPLAADHPARATAVLGRIEAALAAVGAPAPRLAHDARTGNWRGVGRCLAAGVPAALVEARRRELLAAEPSRAEEAQRQLARARVARKLGTAEAARGAFEAALAADPLDPAAREELAAFQRAGRS